MGLGPSYTNQLRNNTDDVLLVGSKSTAKKHAVVVVLLWRLLMNDDRLPRVCVGCKHIRINRYY